MRVLDLFSGIGGFSLGLERTGGFETVAFCEICPKARKVLSKHWPNVKQYEDIKELSNEQLIADGIEAEVICGGFPCQDISFAGKGAGICGNRSGLFFEVVRLVRTIRPKYLILENVSALLRRGMGVVLGELSEIGYNCQWHCITASCIGAPHKRDRIWIVADSNGYQYTIKGKSRSRRIAPEFNRSCLRARQIEYSSWTIEPNVGRVADGVPNRVDRLKQLGNSVVPQIPELIGNAILEVEG